MPAMTEQNEDQGIIMPIPLHIEAMKSLAPHSTANQQLVWNKGPYWNVERGQALPHHQAALGAYASFVERETLGQITPDDLTHSITLLRWVTGLSPHPDEIIALDPIRGPAIKTIFEYRLERIAQFEGKEAIKQMLASYRTIVRAMVESHWMTLPKAQIMDERLGYLRDCTNGEKLTLLENRLRKNAQTLIEG